MPDTDTNGGVRLCILGSEAAGKTCFLGGLAILSEPNRHSSVHVIGADQEEDSGSPSQAFLNGVARALRAGDWPPPTTMTRDVELDLRFRDRLMKVTAIDYAGESFREALNELDDSRQQALINQMLVSDFILLMLDPVFDLPDETTLTSDELQHMHERQNAHVSGIRKIFEDAKVRKRRLPAVALVVTKADLVPQICDGDSKTAERFVTDRGGALLEKIRAWGVETACFAVSAVGGVDVDAETGYPRPRPSLNPYGYDAIFDWVIESTRTRKRQKFMRRVVAPVTVFVLAFLMGMILQTQHAAKVVPDTSKDLEARVNAANRAWFGGGEIRRSADALVADELGQMREQFESLSSDAQLKVLRERFQILSGLKRTTRREEIAEFERVLSEADRKLSYRRIASMSLEDPDRLAASEDFLKRFPGAKEATEVAGMLREMRGRQDEIDREKVRRVLVTKGDKDSLNRKAAAIMEYLLAHPDADDAAEMRKAADAARRLAGSEKYRVTLSSGGTFVKARRFAVEIFVDGKMIKELESDGKVKRATWDETFDVTGWTPGTQVEVKAMDRAFIDEKVGSLVDQEPLSLKVLGIKGALKNDPGFGGRYMEKGYFEFVSTVEGFSAEDWKNLELFVAPGQGW